MDKINYKPGMVLNTKYNNFFSNTIQTGMSHYWSHTAWIRQVTEDKVYVQEALGSRTKRVTSSWYDREHFDKLFANNRLEVLDFGIEDDINFKLYCAEMEGMPYDYFAIVELATSRLISLFGFSSESFLHSRWLSKISKLYDKDYTTEKKVDCSEMILRGISRLKTLNVLEILNIHKYEFGTPQHVSLLHHKLKVLNKL